MSISVRESVRDFLRKHKMTHVFGNPGSTELGFFKDWPADFTYVLGLQESTVLAMADGFAQANGSAAFVNLHSAGGLGHAMGSLFSAYRNQTPLIVTAGQQTRALLLNDPYLFAVSATEMPKPYIKWSCEPARAEDVPHAIAEGYYYAMQPPQGPVFISIPEDDWGHLTEPVNQRHLFTQFGPDREGIERLAKALNQSRSPALVVGPLIDQEGCKMKAVALAEKLAAPVWVAPVSSRSSFPESHPLFAGFLDATQSGINEALASHDLVVVLGAPIFTIHIYQKVPLLSPKTEVWQLTSDPHQIAIAATGNAILTSMTVGIQTLLPLLTAKSHGKEKGAKPPRLAPQDPMSPEYVMQTLSEAAPKDALIVEEAPTHRQALHTHFPIQEHQQFFVAASGSLGWGLPAAVGVALARPKSPVIALIGDGSALYSIQALWTAAQHRLPIVFAFLNNKQYGAMKAFSGLYNVEKKTQEFFDLPGIDLIHLAKGFGCQTVDVQKSNELAPALKLALTNKGPTVLNIAVALAKEALYS